MAPSNEVIVRRFWDVLNQSQSVDEVMAELEPLMDPEIEYVNPPDAIERGTRKGIGGMRTVIENFVEGVGADATVELEEVEEQGDRVFVQWRVHAQGRASGAAVAGSSVAGIYTFRDGRVRTIEWHYDVDEARARFEQER